MKSTQVGPSESLFTVPLSNLLGDHQVSKTLKKSLEIMQSILFKPLPGIMGVASEISSTNNKVFVPNRDEFSVCCLNLLWLLDFHITFCFQTKERKRIPPV